MDAGDDRLMDFSWNVICIGCFHELYVSCLKTGTGREGIRPCAASLRESGWWVSEWVSLMIPETYRKTELAEWGIGYCHLVALRPACPALTCPAFPPSLPLSLPHSLPPCRAQGRTLVFSEFSALSGDVRYEMSEPSNESDRGKVLA